MKINLPDSVASAQDLTSLQLEVRDYARWFAHESIKKQVDGTSKSEPIPLSNSAKDLIREWSQKNELSRQNLDELIEILDDYSHDAPSITLTLAGPPANDLKSTLVGWCRKNIASNILVNFQFNSTILGGIVVRYGSHVFDWSFKRQILAARNNFPEVLKRV